MSIDQSAYPDWMWDGSCSEDEVRERLGYPPLDRPDAVTPPASDDLPNPSYPPALSDGDR